MTSLNVIIKAQKELTQLAALTNMSEDDVMMAEIAIDNHADSYDGSQSITDFVDMCIALGRAS